MVATAFHAETNLCLLLLIVTASIVYSVDVNGAVLNPLSSQNNAGSGVRGDGLLPTALLLRQRQERAFATNSELRGEGAVLENEGQRKTGTQLSTTMEPNTKLEEAGLEIVVDGKERPLVAASLGSLLENSSKRVKRRRLLGALTTPLLSLLSLVPEQSPTVDSATNQPQYTVWAYLERNTAGPQLQIRLKDNTLSALLLKTVNATTGNVLPLCKSVITDACGYALRVTVGPVCDTVVVGAAAFPNSLWCQTRITILPIAVPNATTSLPLVTAVAISTSLDLTFTTDTLIDPPRFDTNIGVRVNMRRDTVAEPASPFDLSRDAVDLWVTGRCAAALSTATTIEDLERITGAVEGDRVCVFVRAKTRHTVNLEFVEVTGCVRDIDANSTSSAGVETRELVVDGVPTTGACARLEEGMRSFPVFSLLNSACTQNSGSCGTARVRRYDAAALDFPCVSPTTGVQQRGVCATDGKGGANRHECPSGLVCGNVNGTRLEPTRAITTLAVPPQLNPSRCWRSAAVAFVDNSAEACTRGTNDTHCATPCLPAASLIAIEFALPHTGRPNTTSVRYDVQLSLHLYNASAAGVPVAFGQRRRALLGEAQGSASDSVTSSLQSRMDFVFDIAVTKREAREQGEALVQASVSHLWAFVLVATCGAWLAFIAVWV